MWSFCSKNNLFFSHYETCFSNNEKHVEKCNMFCTFTQNYTFSFVEKMWKTCGKVAFSHIYYVVFCLNLHKKTPNRQFAQIKNTCYFKCDEKDVAFNQRCTEVNTWITNKDNNKF